MSNVIINPGSKLGDAVAATDWTNTYATARAAAAEWLARMRADGIADVELVTNAEPERAGRWSFTFRHTVTEVAVELETHGIDNITAYEKQHLFAPRVYWNGSSTANPSIEDFAKTGYVMTYRLVQEAPDGD